MWEELGRFGVMLFRLGGLPHLGIDVAEVLPASTKTYDLRPDNPGKWMFHCHVNDHLTAGMMTTFTVN